MKTWLTFEGVMLWSVPICALLAYLLKSIGIDFGSATALGRTLLYPYVIFIHIAVSLLALVIMLRQSKFNRLLLILLGIIISGMGLYSFWWPGYVVTSYFMSIGGAYLVFNCIKPIKRA
jgi:hypothetical protein